MKLLLKEDVENLGITGDVVEVAAGFARNYLLPKDLARTINRSTVQEIEKAKKNRHLKETQRKADLAEMAGKLAGVTVTVKARASEAGTLYGAISADAVAAGLREQGYAVAAKAVRFEEPVKALGEFTVGLHLHAEVNAAVRLVVELDESEPEPAELELDELEDDSVYGDPKIEAQIEKELDRKYRRGKRP